ncbi:uncharacterized protein FOMMEDRAFT_156733 [Fomitiporia mediterranea MF3/22]|uniref:uncharacterized protein n=1 Tax=Fomitiporia mediterranea (strain MF3/22) TaxID=694068 RepID=UPI0004407420|nr:uncharacterized protein FOMMEDRAFT_156733 [Fomitiporia mediterranea MF3/22]EJD03342.1 hypothetical protein FOMMEDRAFT_156733 [Fomitiporia mediterranea MF3/22]
MSKRRKKAWKSPCAAAEPMDPIDESVEEQNINHVGAIQGIVFFIQQAEECGLSRSQWSSMRQKLENLVNSNSSNVEAFEQGIVIHYNQTRRLLLNELHGRLKHEQGNAKNPKNVEKIKTAYDYAANTQEISVDDLHNTE